MNDFLIYQDKGRIKLATVYFESSISFAQAVYDKFLSVGLKLNLQDIEKIFYGVDLPVNEWLKTLSVLVTDSTFTLNLKQYIADKKPLNMGMFRLETSLMEIKHNVVFAKPDAIKTLVSRFSYKATTKEGATLARKLLKLCEALNDTIDFIARQT